MSEGQRRVEEAAQALEAARAEQADREPASEQALDEKEQAALLATEAQRTVDDRWDISEEGSGNEPPELLRPSGRPWGLGS